jgi:energy-coupling factor transporter ATP-binding protein EcfA2
MSSKLQIEIKKFRSVESADIKIDGITLVAGENGSGKSTISKILYYLFKTVRNFEELVVRDLKRKLNNIYNFFNYYMDDVLFDFDRQVDKDNFENFMQLRNLFQELFIFKSVEESKKKWDIFLNEFKRMSSKILSLQSNDENFSRMENWYSRRIERIAKDMFAKDFNLQNQESFFVEIEKRIDIYFKEAENQIEARPTSLFVQRLKEIFGKEDLPDLFKVTEFDDLIFSIDEKNFSIPYNIENSIYIDTPMMFSINRTRVEHWDDLNTNLRSLNPTPNSISHEISEILSGDVEYEETILKNEFRYKRNDEQIFNLLDVATGIKSFSILQLLLKNGFINNKTLLIIDEPESNLHPQWIIEYARIIVMLNKNLGVNFFLTSHNPDMVSAIRYISEKNGILDNVNFYLAKKVENSFMYEYLYLGNEIDPIFESFNIALDRINEYGI